MSQEFVEFPEKGSVQDSMRALMPHLQYTAEELDQLHPSLVPPEDEQMDDLIDDEQDVVYQKGLEVAQGIQEETSAQGRRRRPLEAAGKGAAGTSDKSCYRTKTLRCQKDETAAAEVEQELDALSKEECLERAPLFPLLHLLDRLRPRLDLLPAGLPRVRLRPQQPPVLPSARAASGNPSATLDGNFWLKCQKPSRD